MPSSWAMWAIGRRGWAAIRPTRVSLPAGVSRALAWAMRPPVGAVPSDSPHLTWRPHLTSTTSMGRTPKEACEAVYATPGDEQMCATLSQVSLAGDNVFGDDGGIHQLAAMAGNATRLHGCAHHRRVI